MEPLVVLIVFVLLVVLVAFPLWALFRILALGKDNAMLTSRVADLARQVEELRETSSPADAWPPAAPARPTAPLLPATIGSPRNVERPPAPFPLPAQTSLPRAAAPPAISAPPVIAGNAAFPLPAEAPASAESPASGASGAAPPLFAAGPPPAARRPRPSGSPINWEQFTGAKLLAYAGGLAAFLGAAFFLKYSFEHDLIPPEMRVAIGYLFALGLIIGGLRVPRPRYATTAQTLCATGVVSLYAVTFAASSIYHFPFFGPVTTFLLMALVTAVAFVLAVRLEAQVVAVLGMVGGFLTPVLLSTGGNHPVALFGYVALLDSGLVAVALHRRWHFLVPLGAAGTILMQLGWAEKFLNAAEAPTAMVICLAFCALFLAAYFVAQWRRQSSRPITRCAVAFPLVAFGFAAVFLTFGSVAARPGLLFSFVIAADLCLLALAWWDEASPRLHLLSGAVVFLLLAAWTTGRMTTALLPWALGFDLLYAVLHTAFPLLLERRRPGAGSSAANQVFPALALLLMAGPLLKLDHVSLAFWPAVLLVDLLAILLAVITASLMCVALVLVLTLGVTALWIFRVPASIDAAPSLFLVIGGFAVLFFAAGLFLAGRLGTITPGDGDPRTGRGGDRRAQIPALSGLLPYLLLMMMAERLPLVNPSGLFGVALLLAGLTLGLARLLTLPWLPACALAGVAALEYAWHARHFSISNPGTPLAWYLLFYGGFTVFPFFSRRHYAAHTGPWAVAALAGVLAFPLIYHLVERVWPNDFMGLLPALFALPPLVSFGLILRAPSPDLSARRNQLAWFGGVALLFITLIFPIQFERDWVTLGWALEGVALLALFRRVDHPALRATGVVLLVAAFTRLALEAVVLDDHARGAVPILNGYLYTYGVVSACLFAGVRLLVPPRDRTLGLRARALLGTLGTVLAFLLLNIEIADFFTPPGQRVAFDFSGNFARDMTHTIAWSLFALGLLLVSFGQNLRSGRYAALALLGVALLKLFLHDLARLEALYRIGALFGVAVIAIVASIAYQRFLPGGERNARDKPESGPAG